MESSKMSILCLIALSEGMPGGSRTLVNLPKISSQHEVSIPSTLLLSCPPSAANAPLVSSSHEGATS